MLSVENDAHQTSHKRYFLRTVEIKDYNVMIDGQNFFDQPVNNNIKTYEIFKKNNKFNSNKCYKKLLHF